MIFWSKLFTIRVELLDLGDEEADTGSLGFVRRVAMLIQVAIEPAGVQMSPQ